MLTMPKKGANLGAKSDSMIGGSGVAMLVRWMRAMDGVVEELLRRVIARPHGHGSVWMDMQLSFLGFGVNGTWVSGVTWHVIWPRG